MSLSPEDYERSIAVITLECDRPTSPKVLLFRDGKIVSQWPSCGHSVYLDTQKELVFLPTWFDGEEDMVYPAVYEDGRYRPGEEELSHALFLKIQAAFKKFHLKEELKATGLEPVTAENYVANVLRTESCDMGPILERLGDEHLLAVLLDAMRAVVQAADVLDMCKKNIFYGRQYDKLDDLKKKKAVSPHCAVKVYIEDTEDIEIIRMLHAAVGMTTEAGELIEMFKHIYDGCGFDHINAVEEIGDSMWYIGVACDALGISLQEVMQKNIDKLRTRYPEKFTEAAANERDLKKEREILSGKQPGMSEVIAREEEYRAIGLSEENILAKMTEEFGSDAVCSTPKSEQLPEEDLPPPQEVLDRLSDNNQSKGTKTLISTPSGEPSKIAELVKQGRTAMHVDLAKEGDEQTFIEIDQHLVEIAEDESWVVVPLSIKENALHQGRLQEIYPMGAYLYVPGKLRKRIVSAKLDSFNETDRHHWVRIELETKPEEEQFDMKAGDRFCMEFSTKEIRDEFQEEVSSLELVRNISEDTLLVETCLIGTVSEVGSVQQLLELMQKYEGVLVPPKPKQYA